MWAAEACSLSLKRSVALKSKGKRFLISTCGLNSAHGEAQTESFTSFLSGPPSELQPHRLLQTLYCVNAEPVRGVGGGFVYAPLQSMRKSGHGDPSLSLPAYLSKRGSNTSSRLGSGCLPADPAGRSFE